MRTTEDYSTWSIHCHIARLHLLNVPGTDGDLIIDVWKRLKDDAEVLNINKPEFLNLVIKYIRRDINYDDVIKMYDMIRLQTVEFPF
jgi:hypothetical protein